MTEPHNGEELRQIIERLERLDAEKADTMEAAKEVMNEAKARGYEPKIIRQVIKLRAMPVDERAEQEAVLEMYKAAVGM